MIIKIDMDGVIRNINETMCEMYNGLFEEHLTVEDIFDYDVDKTFKRIQEEMGMTACNYFFDLSSKEVFLNSSPYDGVREAIMDLRHAGHKVVIVTWQYNLENKYNTLLFLQKNKIPYDDICFTRDKWMIQGDWLIDDNPEFIEDEREKSSKIMIRMPYNKNCKFFCTRANDLKEAVDIILEQEKFLKAFLIKEENKLTEQGVKFKVDNYKKRFNYDTD